MLAKQEWHHPPCDPFPEVEYNGFPFWHALLVEPNREAKSAEWLKRVNVHVYLPMFSKRVRRPRGRCAYRQCAVLPGMLFVPTSMMSMSRRDEILEWAHVRGFIRTAGGHPAIVEKAGIEIIREIEGRLNIVAAATKKYEFQIGERVGFINGLYAAFIGEGTVIEIVSENRIGIKVDKLFGSERTVYVSAPEIEAM